MFQRCFTYEGEWAEKLQRYTKLTEHNIKSNPKRASDIEVIRAGEAERVLKVLTPQVPLLRFTDTNCFAASLTPLILRPTTQCLGRSASGEGHVLSIWMNANLSMHCRIQS